MNTTKDSEPAEPMSPDSDQAVAVPGAAAVTPVEDRNIQSAILELVSRHPDLDTDKVRALIDMQHAMEDRAAERAFNRDMSKAQARCQAVVREREAKMGDKGSWKYADLAAIDLMLRPIMTEFGFSITYDRKPRSGDGGGLEIIGTLRHRDGHSITASFPLALDSGPGRNNAQAAGSTDSYGRKYVLLGLFNIVRKDEDTDGVDAGGQPLRADEKHGRDKALRIKELVDRSGVVEKIVADSDAPMKREDALRSYLKDILRYEVATYLDVRQEDYDRLIRLLRIEVDNREREINEEARL